MNLEQGGSPSNPDPATETKQDTLISISGRREPYLEIPKGSIAGESRSGVGGHISNLTTGEGIRDIWEGPGNRTRKTANYTPYFSSSDNGDSGLVLLFGINDSLEVVLLFATANGQTPVAFNGDVMTITSFNYIGTPATFNGTSYIADDNTAVSGVPADAKIQCVSKAGYGNGSNALTVVPSGFTLFIHKINYYSNKGKDITFFSSILSSDQAEILIPGEIEAYQSNPTLLSEPLFTLPEGMTFIFKASTFDTNVRGTILADGVLVDNDFL